MRYSAHHADALGRPLRACRGLSDECEHIYCTLVGVRATCVGRWTRADPGCAGVNSEMAWRLNPVGKSKAIVSMAEDGMPQAAPSAQSVLMRGQGPRGSRKAYVSKA
jgi:hypothetical protein